MQCFEIDEGDTAGLWVVRFPEAHVPVRGHAPLLLDSKLSEFISQIPKDVKGDLRLFRANLMLAGETVRLAPEPAKWKDRKALVRIETSAGLGGTISLTADCYAEEWREGRVERPWLPFPSPGVKVVWGSTEPVADKEASALELFVVMEEGASFHITRTGDLGGASPDIFVRWYGDHIVARVPGRYRRMHQPKGPRQQDPRVREAVVEKTAKRA
jgi:hypothetical protein